MDIVFPLLLQIILIALNAVFACAEIAVISMNEAKLNKLIVDGNKRATMVQKMISNPSKFLSTIQIAITVSGFLGSAFAADNFAGMLVVVLSKTGIVTENNIGIFNTVAVVAITIILSFFTLVFGELIPKRIGMRKSESIALSLAPFLYVISKLFTPFIAFLTFCINSILKLIGIDPNESDGDEGEENILLMVDMSSEKGLIDKEEQEMIQNVFQFDDLSVVEFATHRKDVEVLWEEDNIEQWDAIIKATFHKFYPICKDSVDNIIGVLDIRKYFKLSEKNKAVVLSECISEPYFIPATLKADTLFRQMKQTGNKFAVILDEYGGVEGVVTIDDILEQIVGDFNDDDYSPAKPSIIQLEESVWRASGSVEISEVNEILKTKFSENEYETLGGLIFDKYGHVPPDGSVFDVKVDDVLFSVRKIVDHQIEDIIIKYRFS